MSTDSTNQLNKLKQLRSAFAIARKAMPFLEQIFGFIQEVEPLLNKVNQSIRETTDKMPRATSRLESVSEATELATTEIMDLIDEVFEAIETFDANRDTYHERTQRLQEMDAAFLERLRDELDPDTHAALLEEAETYTEKKKEMCDACRAGIDGEKTKLEDVENKLNHILMSLQVQDITSQKINSVNHLIHEIRDRMSSLLDNLGDTQETDGSSGPDPDTFNANAEYNRDGSHQQNADDVIAAFSQNDSSSSEEASQEGINALFDAGDAATDTQSGKPSSNEPASQDDIDDLFGGKDDGSQQNDEETDKQDDEKQTSTIGGDGEVASQDDIDGLFA